MLSECMCFEVYDFPDARMRLLQHEIIEDTNNAFQYGIEHCGYNENYIKENREEFCIIRPQLTEDIMFAHKAQSEDKILFIIKRHFDNKNLKYIVEVEFPDRGE